MNEASYFQLLGMVEEAIRTAADDSMGQLVEQLRQGAIPRETIEAALQQFDGVFYETLAGAYSQVLGTTMGVQSIKALEVGGLKLSTAMYGYGKAVTEEVLGIINRHAKGMQSARKLALEIYEGYGFRDPAAEPLKLSPRNPKLPKYLREVLRDENAKTAMQRIITRAQATEIKTPNLRAAYLQAIDEFENGAGMARLQKVLDVAANERMRYFANRIAQTELHRAYSDQQAREFMADKSVEVVQVKMSATHPKVDICDMHSSLNKYGLGPGCYPKPLAPKPPFHPFCRCILQPRWDLKKAAARDRAKAEQAFLIEAGDDGPKIMGSRAKWIAAKNGTPVEEILNAGKDPMYRLARVGDDD